MAHSISVFKNFFMTSHLTISQSSKIWSEVKLDPFSSTR